MQRVEFRAFGHQNIIGKHSTTLEITSERNLTKQGTCIVGVNATATLNKLDKSLKALAMLNTTRIVLRMTTDGLTEEVSGWGGPGLTYSDSTSMVARTSSYECDRTLMVRADKAASDLNRSFVERLKSPGTTLHCEVSFFTGP